ncbi:MAG: Ig-like domain-containing protein [Chloroflexota bacterium]
MSRFTQLALAVIVGLGLTIGGLSVALARLGPAVDTLSTASTIDGTLVETQIALTFTQPMRIPSVERAFRLEPRTPGAFSWSGNEMLFTPSKSLRYSQAYNLTVGTRAVSASGHRLQHAFSASFTTQGRHLLYLGTAGVERGHLVLATLTGRRQVVDDGSGHVTGYAVSPDHSLVVYAKKGSSGERSDELWLINLADNSAQMVFRRPAWNMTEPHLSPDNRYIVFLATDVLICRQYEHCYSDTSSPLVYFFDLNVRRVFPFKSQSDVPITNFIDFSPAGQIAYTDLGSALVTADPNGNHVVHIPNSGNALEYQGFDPNGDKAVFVGQTPSSSGGDILMYTKNGYVDISHGVYDSSTPSFSNSGGRVAYAGYRGEQGIEPIYGINEYDLRTRRTRRLAIPAGWTDWSPRWSLDDRYVAWVRMQPQEAMYLGSGEVWAARADGKDAHPLGAIGRDVSWVS